MNKNYSTVDKIKDIFNLLIKSFVLSFVCFIVFIVVVMAIYYGDLYFNVKSGNYKSPLFNSYVIVSPSMVPTININDAIVVKRESNDKYKIGDIISFFSTEHDANGNIITHRVVGKNHVTANYSNYVTKGDNNPIPDRLSVDTTNIYGKVIFIIPHLGNFQSFLSKPINFILLILFPALVIVAYDLGRIIGSFRKSRLNF